MIDVSWVAKLFSNGIGTKAMSSFIALLLIATLSAAFDVNSQLGTLNTNVKNALERLDRHESRIQYLERHLPRNRGGESPYAGDNPERSDSSADGNTASLDIRCVGRSGVVSGLVGAPGHL